jgi:hypothetical protein
MLIKINMNKDKCCSWCRVFYYEERERERERERDAGRFVLLAHFKRFWYKLIGDEESINEGYR